jgi:type IX secretion system PorP/SprF family membrane protein
MMRKIIFIVLIVVARGNLCAQMDPHFSQYYAFPMWLNPGMTGVMKGDYRVTSVYRNQWSNVMTPFVTTGLSADVATNKNINIGANILNQTAGNAGYRYTTAYLNLAYSGIRVGPEKNHQVTAGIQVGMLSRRFDPSKFQFGDQWNPVTGFSPTTPTADAIKYQAVSVLDMGAGLSYLDNSPDKTVNLFGGISAAHINQPYDPFTGSTYKDFVPIRYGAHFGVRTTINDRFSLTPNFIFMQQANSREIMGGLFAQYYVNEDVELYGGAAYRLNDAFSVSAGLGYRHFVVGASYDMTSSDLSKTTPGTKAFEISLSYTHPNSGKSMRYLSCPRF